MLLVSINILKPGSHILCIFSHTRLRSLLFKVSMGHLMGRPDPKPAARSLFTIIRTDFHKIRRIISTRRRGAETKPLSLTIRINYLSSRIVVRILRPERLCWCGCVANFADATLRHTHHSCHFSLRIILSRQSYNSHQYLFLQITRHDTLKEW